jgi:hypothetical protein
MAHCSSKSADGKQPGSRRNLQNPFLTPATNTSMLREHKQGADQALHPSTCLTASEHLLAHTIVWCNDTRTHARTHTHTHTSTHPFSPEQIQLTRSTHNTTQAGKQKQSSGMTQAVATSSSSWTLARVFCSAPTPGTTMTTAGLTTISGPPRETEAHNLPDTLAWPRRTPANS